MLEAFPAGVPRILAALLLFFVASAVRAEEVLRLYRPDALERPVVHADLVLEEAMRRTTNRYGAYRIERVAQNIVRERLMIEMIKGNEINVAVVPGQPIWEAQLLPIYIPVDMGLSGYRISLVRRDVQARISAAHNEQELRKFRLGVGSGWSSRKVFEANGYDFETAANQDLLTRMLLAGRFDHFPRGVNEVFVEFDEKAAANPDLVIESDWLLRFPLPNYVFVSPANPRLAKRLTEGLESMVRDGTLLRMVKRFHADMLQRAALCTRRVVQLNNPLLSEQTPLGRKELWFDPFDRKTGLCSSGVRHVAAR